MVNDYTFYVACLQLGEERIKSIILENYKVIIRNLVVHDVDHTISFEYDDRDGDIFISPFPDEIFGKDQEHVKLTDDLYINIDLY